jgi:molybdopterin converting factor small subunit
MAILRLRQPLKRMAGEQAEHRIEAPTVGDLVRELERGHPELSGWILDECGSLRRHINVYVNGEPADEASALGPDDRIELLPAISGG